MKEVNSLVICRDNYSTCEEWEDVIKKMVMSLLEARQIMTVYYDEPGLGVVAFEFNPDDQKLEADYPYWLSPEEAESVIWDDEREEEA